MERRSIFFDEWIKSLREQYKYVIRNNDQVTLPSLTNVMHNVGFSDDELAQLRVEATMHVDDVGADYVPDMQVLEKAKAGQPHPAECTCPQCIPIDESQFDDEGQPLVNDDPEKDTHETGHVFAAAKIEEPPVTEEVEPEAPPAIEESVVIDAPIPEPLAEPEEELLTFEDSLDIETIEEEIIEEDVEDEEDDPDQPKQMSMF